jgi:hypothetical protein
MSASAGFMSAESNAYMAADFSAAGSGFHHGYPLDSSSANSSPVRPPGGPTLGLMPEMSRSAFHKVSPASAKKSPPKSPGACRAKEAGSTPAVMERTEPVTLNLIVREELNPAPDCVVTKGDIANAVELTARPINKRAVYRDLETILAHEIHLGYVLKHGDNAFSLPDISKGRNTYRGTIPLKSSKRKPKPTQKYLESTQKYLEMEAEMARFRQQDNTNKFSGLVRLEPGISHYELPYPTNGAGNLGAAAAVTAANAASPTATMPQHLKTEDELKDDLIKEKLISNNLLKMKSKMKGNKVKVKKEDPVGNTAVKEEPLALDTDTAIKQELVDSADEKPRSPSTKKLQRLKKETWHLTDTVKYEKTAGGDESRLTGSPASLKAQPVPSIKSEVEADCGEDKPAAAAAGTSSFRSLPAPAPSLPTSFPPSPHGTGTSAPAPFPSSTPVTPQQYTPPAPPPPSVAPLPVASPAVTAPTSHAAKSAVSSAPRTTATANKENSKRGAGKAGKKTAGQKRKREEDSDEELSDSPAAPPVAPLTRTLSGRKKVPLPVFYLIRRVFLKG